MPIVLKSWESQTPGALRACKGLFYLRFTKNNKIIMTDNINVNGNRIQFTIPQMAEVVSSELSHVSGSPNLESVLFQHIVMLLFVLSVVAVVTDVAAEHTVSIFRVQVQIEAASSSRFPGNQVPDYMVKTSSVMFLGRKLLVLEELCTVYKSVHENAIVFCIDTNCVKMSGPSTVACERDFH